MNAKDLKEIIRLSAYLCHYAGDAHMPLHSCANYDGQLTGQKGVHKRWESTMLDLHDPEENMKKHFGTPGIVRDPKARHFNVLLKSYEYVHVVLKADKAAGGGGRGKYDYKLLHQFTGALADKRLGEATTFTASLWLTAWALAGKPRLE